MKSNFLYTDLTERMAQQIRKGVYQPGDRLPSVRKLCQEHGISSNTAKRVFMELEAQSLILSKPQSGYFVCPPPFRRPPLAEASKPSAAAANKEPEALISKVYASMGKRDLTLFSIGMPSSAILPVSQMNREITLAGRALADGGAGYEPLHGNEKLRKVIAARSMYWGGNLGTDDIVTTAGGMNALSFSLMALTKPGDTIALESPCYPGILQLAKSLGLKVLELPTHPTTGVEIPALKKVLQKIDVCLLVPNFNTPLGYCMPDENKRAVANMLAAQNIPLIEDDIYGELYFGARRPTCCKAYDEHGSVLLCGSFSKSLAPGHRVGWVVPGKYKEQILKLKLVHAIANTSLTHEATASFVKSGRYDQHLRKLRSVLEGNYHQYIQVISEHFPEGTKTSRPQGGLSLWVELDKSIDTIELFEMALKRKISISPGRIFSLQEQFGNCIRLSTGLPWSEELRQHLKVIGRLAKSLI